MAYRGGSPVRLGDLGRVIDSIENDKSASWFNDERAIVLAIQRQPGTNTVAVVQAIKDILPSYQAIIPAAMNLNIMYDRSQSIKESIRDVQITLIVALVLVVLVIFLFLRNLSATIIPSLALPTSIVGTFAVMYLGSTWTTSLSWRSPCAWASWWMMPSSCWRISYGTWSMARARVMQPSTGPGR